MPYSGPNDDKLPPNVKAMPPAKRRKWVRIWNAAFKNCRSSKIGAPGSVEDCEKAAFKFANGAVKEMEMEEDEGQKDHECEGEPCEKCMAEAVPYHPLGGATSFDEADKYEEANKLENHIREQEYLFRRINDNIFASDASLAEKLAKVKAAATELEGRLEKPEEKGLLERVKDVVSSLGVGTTEKATKKEDGKDFPAGDYAYVPDATKPSGWKLRLTKTPGGGPDAGIVGAAIAALGKGFRGQKVSIPAADLAGVKAKVRAAWKKANPDKKPADMPAAIKEAVGAFRAFKDALGNWRWMTLTTNIWRDRDGEILPSNAHEVNVAYADRTKDMPELRLWHVLGSGVGMADWADFAHGFVLHTGTFHKGMEDIAESLAASKKPLAVSHGFYHDKDKDSDIYPWYQDFEVTVLPAERAANAWTEFNAQNLKEVAMGLSTDKRAFLVEHMGEARVVAIEKGLEEKEEELKAGGIDFKEAATEVLADAIEATAEGDPKPAEGDGDGDAPKGDDAIAKLTTLVEAQGTQLIEIAAAQGEQADDIKALKASDDEKIAAAMSPERKPPAGGERPSESAKTEITAEEAAKQGADPALDSDELEKTPGGRALKQIARIQ